ncbi:MAG TPA: VOC family protein [Vineibacter sp.]|nr:VOC family protein [Vineibacter sp.]
MPSLETFRKQAKLVLRWHRDRYHPVAAQIRTHLTRFRHLSDAAVLDHAFKLADAQELVARQAGFDSWLALKRGVTSMSDATDLTAARPRLVAAEPQLFVADIGASCAYFTGKLGFAVAFTYGEPPFYGQVARDGVALNLRCVVPPLIDSVRCAHDDLLSASITVETRDAIKQLFLEFQSAGAVFHQTLRSEPWGARTFIVKDPDGNLLLFSGPDR